MNNVLDQSVLDELMSFAAEGDPEFMLDLINMFLEDSPSKVAAIQAGLAVGDFDRAERAAHSLKGSSGNLGAHLVYDICEKLQQSTRKHQLAASRRLAPVLAENYSAAEQALKKILYEYTI